MGERSSAPEVFGLLSDQTRVDILCAVAEVRAEIAPMEGQSVELGFSEIYDRVDVDNTSKLSYHLGELTGTFLRKGEEGYTFTHAGERIVRFVLSENYREPSTIEPTPVDGQCPFCGESALRASLREKFFYVKCAACERPVIGQPVTPAQVRGDDEAAVIRSVREKHSILAQQWQVGLCPECGARLEEGDRSVQRAELAGADLFVVSDQCGSCLRRYNAPMAYRIAYHPASIAFHWDRGIDVTSKSIWAFHEHVLEGRWESRRTSTDPDEYEVRYHHDTDTLRVTLDEHAKVTHTERVRRSEVSSDHS